MLSQFQHLVVKQFGHLSQNVVMLAHGVFGISPDCYRTLVGLAEKGRLKSLTVRCTNEGFFQCQLPFFKFEGVSLPDLLLELSRKLAAVVHLRVHINFYRIWHDDVMASINLCPNSDWRCKCLKALRIISGCLLEWQLAEMNPSMPTATPTAALVSKFPSLKHLKCL